MSNLSKELYNPFFSHIYIEKDILSHETTRKILSCFPEAVVIEVPHYKDVFCRSRQSYSLQKKSPNLILAGKHNSSLYEGAPVCQNFGHTHFYYTSSVMNCFYDCEYCYLQGMYPSANLVVFVNLEDIFREVELLLEKHPVYLCISYDTDLLALEHYLGYVSKWNAFASKQKDLTIELRTKSANWKALKTLTPSNNFILAWTLSPEPVQKKYEHRTPALNDRLQCIKKALQAGFPVRLCFDPLIYEAGWRDVYETMIRTTFQTLPGDKISEASLGVFRVSAEYLKQMRKQRKDSVILQYPYENDKGVYHYSKALTEEMVTFLYELLKVHIPEDKIYIWEESGS